MFFKKRVRGRLKVFLKIVISKRNNDNRRSMSGVVFNWLFLDRKYNPSLSFSFYKRVSYRGILSLFIYKNKRFIQ